jgi:hypothetical protein
MSLKGIVRKLTSRSEILGKGRNDSQAELRETSKAVNSSKTEIGMTTIEKPWCLIYLPPGIYSEPISFDPPGYKPERSIPQPEVLPGEPNPNRPQPPTDLEKKPKRVRKPREPKPKKVSTKQ